MEFTLPTTKTQMMKILDELFYHYRIKRQGYEKAIMQELDLTRMVYNSPTDEELRQKAIALVAPSHEREISKRKAEIESKIAETNLKLTQADINATSLIQEVENLYTESVAKIQHQAVKNGLISSGVVVDKIAELEEGKNEKIYKINSENELLKTNLTATLSSLNEQLAECEEYFSVAHEKDIEKQLKELIDEREKMENEVFKYNNSLDEKEQRYKNTLIQANATLELKFLDISSGEFTKDQLVEMGYYEDVIRCVCGYYNTLEAGAAYQDFSRDTKIPIYLDDYYQNILYMYQARAGL